ncbi:MAG: M64 family metallopeptidase [Bacteroidales bacterium]|nr:M64 family metallopeptidase [Bacteroidales bacterium]MDY0216697.1 M64 family metallopeptidase [Bacteroidales bacterium]
MKKTYLILLFFVFSFVKAQNLFFEDNKAMRIDYHVFASLNMDSIAIRSVSTVDAFSFNENNFLDSFEYGMHKIEIYDSLSNKLIYSKGFSSLYEEWQHTPEALGNVQAFEMSFLFPFPKKSVKLVFHNRTQENIFRAIDSFYFSPLMAKNNSKKASISVMDIHISGSPKNKYDLLIIPDGYSQKEEQKMKEDFRKLSEGLLDCKPYSELKDQINIKGVVAFSQESGVRDPILNSMPQTVLNSSFNTFSSDRYLMLTEVWKMYDLATSTTFDGILIMCNTSKYGGGGIYNLYATACADCEDYAFISVHELGHSVSGLADEYYSSDVSVEEYYPTHIEPWEPNITTLVSFDEKWKDMLKDNTPIPTPVEGYRNVVGVFEGAGYQSKGVYRPAVSCTMKDVVYNNFCPVCSKAIKQMILFYSK